MNEKQKKTLLACIIITFLSAVIVLLITAELQLRNVFVVKKTKQIINSEICNHNDSCHTIEKNGVTFKEGILSINAVNKKGERRKTQFIGMIERRIIEVHSGKFIIETYFNDKFTSDCFICPDNQTWDEFMKFIREKTIPIGIGFSRGSRLYLF